MVFWALCLQEKKAGKIPLFLFIIAFPVAGSPSAKIRFYPCRAPLLRFRRGRILPG